MVEFDDLFFGKARADLGRGGALPRRGMSQCNCPDRIELRGNGESFPQLLDAVGNPEEEIPEVLVDDGQLDQHRGKGGIDSPKRCWEVAVMVDFRVCLIVLAITLEIGGTIFENDDDARSTVESRTRRVPIAPLWSGDRLPEEPDTLGLIENQDSCCLRESCRGRPGSGVNDPRQLLLSYRCFKKVAIGSPRSNYLGKIQCAPPSRSCGIQE